MAINAAMELGRTVGLDPLKVNGEVAPILAGQFVRFADYDLTSYGASGDYGLFPAVTVAKKGDLVANVGDVIGVAADDTVYKGWNGFYETIDGFYKWKKVSAYVLGGQFHIWNDGRGPVFAPDVVGAKPGTPLYIGEYTDANSVTHEGVLTTTGLTDAADAGKIGAIKVGIILRAPFTDEDVDAEAAISASVTPKAETVRGHKIDFVAKNCRAHSVLFFQAVK